MEGLGRRGAIPSAGAGSYLPLTIADLLGPDAAYLSAASTASSSRWGGGHQQHQPTSITAAAFPLSTIQEQVLPDHTKPYNIVVDDCYGYDHQIQVSPTPELATAAVDLDIGDNITEISEGMRAALRDFLGNDDYEDVTSGAVEGLHQSSPSRGRRRSAVWEHCTLPLDPSKKYTYCRYCSKKLTARSKNGTSHVRNHVTRCLTRIGRVDERDELLARTKKKLKGENN